jgi:hypothetical protein
MRLVVPELTFSLLTFASVRVGEKVSPEMVNSPGIWRTVSAPPGKLGRWPK